MSACCDRLTNVHYPLHDYSDPRHPDRCTRCRHSRDDSVTVLGTRFVAVPERGADTVRCAVCGMLVDVGGELRWHAEEHAPDLGRDDEW